MHSDSWNISYGDSMDEVVAKCGQPAKIIGYYNVFNVLVGQEFMYNLGSSQAPRYFYFDRSGKVTRMGD